MRVLLFLMMLSTLAFSQAHNWGNQLRFGPKFANTDSTRLSYEVTKFRGADTLYSDLILTKGDTDEGIYSVAAYLDSVSGAADSMRLQVRMGVNFRKGSSGSSFFGGGGKDSSFVHFGPWQTIWNVMKKDTLYHITISPQDSSWLKPSSGKQYRFYDMAVTNATDTVKFHITELSR